MLKFCLTIDCEGYTMFRQGNPEYTLLQNFKFYINNLIKNFRYNERGFWIFYNEIKKQKFPCTFMLVGRLFRPVEDLEFVEWGYHTYNHLPLIFLSNENIEKETENIFNVESITAPMWRVEEIRDPSRIFNILKKQRYKNTVYHGKNKGVKSFFRKSIRKPEKRFGIKCVYVSNYFEGNWNRKRIIEIKRDILRNLNKEGVYLLSTHDFTHKNSKNLKEIISFVKKLEDRGKIKAVRLKDV